MTEDALTAAIAANPQDQEPQLIYADWLDDQERYDEAALVRQAVLGKRNNDKVTTLLGRIMSDVHQEDDALIFNTINGEKYMLHHNQDCCESVTIDDINGDLSDLVGRPLLMAEESIGEAPEGHVATESETWTFYRFATVKGYVTIRWFGSSNGYYSESVDFCKV
jgi:uncharacterized protein (TIGR02996 family)